MEVRDITNRVVVMNARVVGKTYAMNAMKNIDEEEIRDKVLHRFIDKVLDREPVKISGSRYWNVVLTPTVVSGWEKIIREMIMKNNILHRLGLRFGDEES